MWYAHMFSYMKHAVYKNIDCDNDGVLDQMCYDLSQKWLLLSSAGCGNNWGQNDRLLSECPTGFSTTSEFAKKMTIKNLLLHARLRLEW